MKGVVIHFFFLLPVVAKSQCQAKEIIALRGEGEGERERLQRVNPI